VKRLVALALLLSPRFAAAADAEVARILGQFEKAKPDAKALAFYSLDWAPDLKAAQARARVERRPVFLIANTNITAGCNFYSGHT
jgi:hypothetical protein